MTVATPWLRVGQDGGRVELFVHLDVDVKQTNCSVMKWVKWEITSNRRSQTSTTKWSHSHLSSLVFFLRLPCCCSSSEVLSKEWLQSMSNKTFVQFDFFFLHSNQCFFLPRHWRSRKTKRHQQQVITLCPPPMSFFRPAPSVFPVKVRQ